MIGVARRHAPACVDSRGRWRAPALLPAHTGRRTLRRGPRVLALVLAVSLVGCGRERPLVKVIDSADVAPAVPAPVTLDSAGPSVVEFWTMPSVKGLDPTRRLRRVVEHLQADVAIAPGFVDGRLLAAGDGRTLLALLRWRDTAAAHRARPVIARWFDVRDDDATIRRAAGSATPVVHVTARAGGAPALVADSGVWIVERYALKAGHSFAALERIVQADARTLVAADASVRGAAVLVHADSQAVVRVIQARAVNGLDLPEAPNAPLPAWAPFASRERRIALVVTTVRQRGEPATPARPADSTR